MEKKTAPRICANCKWSEEIDWFEGDYMACECHRYPPTCATDKAFAVFPKVKHESHCGEFAIRRHPRVFEFADASALANAAAPAA